MAWPYALYTDPTIAASILQAAAASAATGGGMAAMAAAASAYGPYSTFCYPLHPRFAPYSVHNHHNHRPPPSLGGHGHGPPGSVEPQPALQTVPTFPGSTSSGSLQPHQPHQPHQPPHHSSYICQPSPTHSETSCSIPRSSPVNGGGGGASENCDGSVSCLCGIVNCVTGGGSRFPPNPSLIPINSCNSNPSYATSESPPTLPNRPSASPPDRESPALPAPTTPATNVPASKSPLTANRLASENLGSSPSPTKESKPPTSKPPTEPALKKLFQPYRVDTTPADKHFFVH